MIGVRRAYPRELVAALREGRPHVFGAGTGRLEPFGLTPAERSAPGAAVGALADPDSRVRTGRRQRARRPGSPAARERCSLPAVTTTPTCARPRSLARRGTPEALPVDPGIWQTTRSIGAPAVRHATASIGLQTGLARPIDAALMEDADPFVRVSAAGALIAADGDPGARSRSIDSPAARTSGAGRRVRIADALGSRDPSLAARGPGADRPRRRGPSRGRPCATEARPPRALDAVRRALVDDQPSCEKLPRRLGTLGEPALGPVVDSLSPTERRAGRSRRWNSCRSMAVRTVHSFASRW